MHLFAVAVLLKNYGAFTKITYYFATALSLTCIVLCYISIIHSFPCINSALEFV